MLRRKLLARLGLLTVCFIAGAVVAIALLEGVLHDLDQAGAENAAIGQGIEALADASIEVEKAAHLGPLSDATHEGELETAAETLAAAHAALADHPMLRGQGRPASETHHRIGELLPMLTPSTAAPPHTVPYISAQLMAEIAELRRNTGDAITARQVDLSRRLRILIIGLTVAAIIMLNITVITLIRTGAMILEPVDTLVEGSRELALERFDHRVAIEGEDEFGKLAHAYNDLAERLQANEARKMEALEQLGVAINHELNNVINVIELQLAFLDRRAGGDEALATHLRQIRENLGRITRTVASLKDVRRIVVTEYAPGTKMFDLPRCIGEEDTTAPTTDALPPNGTGRTESPVANEGIGRP